MDVISFCGALATVQAAEPVPNPTVAENRRPGTTDWQLSRPGLHHEIEGYASRTSVNRGESIAFYVNTPDPEYKIELFRMGWYGGKGARRMGEPILRSSVSQPLPAIDPLTGIIECNWQDPYWLTIPTDAKSGWISGVYLAKLTANRSQKQSYIIFVVRQDDRPSDYLFQSSVTTFQAYNNWGGKSLYRWNSRGGQALKVSFNRPYAPSPNPAAAYGVGAGEFLTNVQPHRRVFSAGWEYNMVRWLEREGYDITYATDIDTHANPNLLRSHRVFLSVGHDEYWSWEMRQNVEAARDAGVSLGFFSSNTCYWQIRLEPGIYGFNRFMPDRTIVAYKEWASLDPVMRDRVETNDRRITTQWRDRRVNRPEAELLGVMYDVDPVLGDITIAPTAPDWILASTNLKPGSRLAGLLGYEVDRISSASPSGIKTIAHSPFHWRRQTRFSDMTMYETKTAAVFATGSMQWSWGLDDFNAPTLRSSYLSQAAQQMTRNVLAHLKAAARQQAQGL
ncbi:N,N-dimethylformamidase beta subunit family domain-containing protein [Leptolyngbya ohadii]|uniref:N,N-dimethylformamidase beta subunit family domain-containing protein n=1 Tax=Leptolyngbya ohadii TaxID=1962290 RepID=UPI000B5A0309|nr:N,N-dimethylformamidase beta subunit family domain-containing protein [Leptolyngbya ohadii]